MFGLDLTDRALSDNLLKWGKLLFRRHQLNSELWESPRNALFLSYSDLLDNPQETAKQVYAWLGLPMSSSAEAAMQAWLTANHQHRLGKPSKAEATQLGVTEEELADLFQDVLKLWPNLETKKSL